MGRVLVLLALHELDRVVDQVCVEVFDLLLGQLDFLERRDNLVVGQKPLFLSLLNELVELFDVGERDVDREQWGLAFSCWDGGGDLCTKRARSCLGPGSPPAAGIYNASSRANRGFFGSRRTCHSARISPTSSPRLFRTGLRSNRSTGCPSLARKAPSAGPTPRELPSSTLSARPRPRGPAAHMSPSAPPFAIQPSRARMSAVSTPPGPRISPGCARIAAATRSPPSSRSRRAKARAIRSSGSAKVTTPQPSIAVSSSSSSRSAARATSVCIACWQGWS